MKAAVPESGFQRKAWEPQKYSRAQIFLRYLENNGTKQRQIFSVMSFFYLVNDLINY